MSALSLKALEVAATQIGKEENPRGSNWGKVGDPVPGYLASVRISFPASWCMAFVYWCFKQASASVQGTLPPKTGGVLNAWTLAKDARVQDPQPGDIFIMDHGHGLGHTGIIEKVDQDGTLHTIEGNTNDEGVREGYEVCRRVRHQQKPIIGYLRF